MKALKLSSLAVCFIVLACAIPTATAQIPIYGYSCCCGYASEDWHTTATTGTPCSTALYAQLQANLESITCTNALGDNIYISAANGTVNFTANSHSSCDLYPYVCPSFTLTGNWTFNFDSSIRNGNPMGQISLTEYFACRLLTT